MARAAVFVVCSLLCLASGAQCGSEQDESCRAVDDDASLLAAHRRIHVKCTYGNTMCAGNQCCPGATETGGMTYRCPSADPTFDGCDIKAALPQCLAEGLTCGSPGQKDCCAGMQCASLGASLPVGPGNPTRCMTLQPQCLAEGLTCGGPGQQDCCAGMQCASLDASLPVGPGNPTRCMTLQPQCLAEGLTCGGAGQLDQPCCGGMQCMDSGGGSNGPMPGHGRAKTCVQPQPQCVAAGQQCGCPGCMTQSCCNGLQCQADVAGGKSYCVGR